MTRSEQPIENVLITGGTGFLGQHMQKQMLEKGWNVSVFDVREPTNSDPRVRVFVGDISNMSQIQEAVKGQDVVFHCASPPYHLNNKQLFYAVNVEGTKNVIKACRLEGVRRLVLTSSASVIYNGAPLANATETTPFPQYHIDYYTQTKMLQEQLVIAADEDNLSTAAIRPHGIFGPNDYTIGQIAQKSRDGSMKLVIGDGSNIVDFTHVSNVVHGHILAAEQLSFESQVHGQVFNITNDEPVHFWAFTRQALVMLGLEAPSKTLPMWLILAIAYLLQFVQMVLALVGVQWQPFLTPFKVYLAGTHHYYNCDKAKEILGYVPLINLTDGLKETVAFLKK